MKTFIKNFITCGILGWCIEILFTALYSLRKRDFTLKGTTSVWMFPIYGLAALLNPFCKLVKGKPVILRGLLYAFCIYLVELTSGLFLRKKELCPWDYGHSKWHIAHVIRLDFLPNWMLTGLLYEKILNRDNPPA